MFIPSSCLPWPFLSLPNVSVFSLARLFDQTYFQARIKSQAEETGSSQPTFEPSWPIQYGRQQHLRAEWCPVLNFTQRKIPREDWKLNELLHRHTRHGSGNHRQTPEFCWLISSKLLLLNIPVVLVSCRSLYSLLPPPPPPQKKYIFIVIMHLATHS